MAGTCSGPTGTDSAAPSGAGGGTAAAAASGQPGPGTALDGGISSGPLPGDSIAAGGTEARLLRSTQEELVYEVGAGTWHFQWPVAAEQAGSESTTGWVVI